MAKASFARAPAVINDALRREIADLLLAGTPAARVTAIIAGRGLKGALVETEVARLAASPAFKAAEAALATAAARLAKRDWLLANQGRLLAARADAETVPRRHRLDGDSFFEDFYCANRPVLVTGLVDDWPARAGWSFAALADRLGHVDVDVQWQRDANPDYEIEADRHIARQNLRAIIRRITDDGPSNDFYVTAYNSGHNNTALAPLWDDIGGIPGWLAPGGGRDGFFWMGPQGTITPFHHDLTNNLMVQIAGQKRVRLVAAAHTPHMRNHRHCFSAWRGDDLPAGPGDGERPPVLEVILEPGDALFLPIGWWHHVEGLTPTIGLSFTNFARPNDFYSHYNSYGAL